MKNQIKLMLATAVASVIATFALPAGAQTTRTDLLRTGTSGERIDIVIIGDGFTANDQGTFDTFVQNTIIEQVMQEGPLGESLSAFNIIRLNTNSTDSGVTQINAMGQVTTNRNTALGYRFSGQWNRCWMELPSSTALDTLISDNAAEADYIFVVLNEANFGGCRSGNRLAVTTGAGWAVAAHEMGHMIGDLCDEYVGGAMPGNYTGTEPGCANLTVNTTLNTMKWRSFVDSNTTLPTVFNAMTMDTTATQGGFAGGTLGQSGFSSGLFRPSNTGRMNDNTPPFNSVGYNQMKQRMDQFHDHNWAKTYTGDFNADERADLLVHNHMSLELYQSDGTHQVPTWTATMPIPTWETFLRHDQFFVGDFDGDGDDDVFVVNLQDFEIPYFAMLRSNRAGFDVVRRYDRQLPGWDDMRGNDKFHVADFDGDGKDDIIVTNFGDWSVGYLGMLRSTGGALQMVRRYDDKLPGWDSIKGRDQFFVADVDADGKEDLYLFNHGDWSMGYLQSLRSTGTSLQHVVRYDREIANWDDFLGQDRFYVADHDGDGDDDLYLWNGPQWRIPYLAKLRSDRGVLTVSRRYDADIPGWQMARADRHFVADTDGDGQKDLYVYNATNWNTEYLGVLRSNGTALQGSWQDDRIGRWNLGAADQFVVGNFNGGARYDDLFVYNNGQFSLNLFFIRLRLGIDWLGLLRSAGRSVTQTVLYPNWIHDHEFHSEGWW
jgi:hypothetical protein